VKAKAVVFEAENQVDFQEIQVPDPTPEHVVIRTRFSWISNGTERSYLFGERSNGETSFQPGDLPVFPLVPGYQKTGTVESVGSEVEGLRPGDWVFVAGSLVNYGIASTGGHVSPAVAAIDAIWKLPDGVDPIAASGLVLTQVGYNCGTRPPVDRGNVGVVVGDGLVGHWAAQTLAWQGAEVIMLGRHEFRLGRLGIEGATTINQNATNPIDALRRRFSDASDGIDILVDTVGDIQTVNDCLPLMASGGHIATAGFYGTEGMIDIQKLRYGEQTLHSPSGWKRERMDQTLKLIASGDLETNSLISHRFPARKAAAAWDLILNRREEFLGVVLEWD
jgi:3-hydroxyethyl bacteriochlorophyllide a dehydrogenase